MRSTKNSKCNQAAGWWILGAAVGVAAAGYLATRRAKLASHEWSADELVDWCEKAADKLDDLLVAETPQARTA